MEFAELSRQVLGCALTVRRALGPGLLALNYEQSLPLELFLNQIAFKFQQSLPVEYKGMRLDCAPNRSIFNAKLTKSHEETRRE